MKPHLIACGLLSLALTAAGCSDPEGSADGRPTSDGALTGPTHWRKVCVSERYSDDFTLGVATAENSSTKEITLLDADLTNADGIELVGTDIVRPGHLMDSFGVWNGYPPMHLASAPGNEKLWRARAPLEGNRVMPGERINFLLHLRGVGRSGPLEVIYRTDGGADATWTSNVRYLIRELC